MKKQENMLQDALSSYGKYTDKQIKVICFLIEHAVDDKIYPAVKKISEKTGVVTPTVYASLRALKIDGIVTECQTQRDMLIINQEKIKFIEKFYEQIQSKSL